MRLSPSVSGRIIDLDSVFLQHGDDFVELFGTDVTPRCLEVPPYEPEGGLPSSTAVDEAVIECVEVGAEVTPRAVDGLAQFTVKAGDIGQVCSRDFACELITVTFGQVARAEPCAL